MATKQSEANARWREKNKEKTRYLNRRSTARSFIKKDATAEDLADFPPLSSNAAKNSKNKRKPPHLAGPFSMQKKTLEEPRVATG